ncbi:DUF2024 family protein [Niabella drilacis]|uniref:DUF2024 domain-containing protein n=1 Tax=Niabella drilacis (strain DSM 25811 / CCM 8410 / CCUG 62505 / LMG 26954 / E90) TaxID=1285928 RepID=A0A1G6IHE0_NIADE|nr:DUF2024 family protein [Niabella drilacis]SDC05982.1 protein of unknown function [Niabella drilacis]
MQVTVWDTYVTRMDGLIMHFDILVPVAINDAAVIYGYGKEYLKTKGQEAQSLTSKECQFCHIEEASPEIKKSVKAKGYHIIEMQGCN